MYHALVFIDGQWVSFGLHVPSNQWSAFAEGLEQRYGKNNVGTTFWLPERPTRTGRVSDIRERMEEDVELANEAQGRWSKNEFDYAVDGDGSLNLARAISALRARRAFARLA